MTIFASIPNTILIPLIICACVIGLFAVLDSIAWIRFKSKQNEPARKAKAAEKAQKAEEARQAKEAEKAQKAEQIQQAKDAEAVQKASAQSNSTNSTTSTANYNGGVMAASSNSSMNGGDNSANPASSASSAQPANGGSTTNTTIIAAGAQGANSATNSGAANGAEGTSMANGNEQGNSSSSNTAFVGGVMAGAPATSAASSVSPESVSIAPEEGTVASNNSNASNTTIIAGGVVAGGAISGSDGQSSNGGVAANGTSASTGTNGVYVGAGVAGGTSDQNICTDNGGSSAYSESGVASRNGAAAMASSSSEASSTSNGSTMMGANGVVLAYSEDAVNTGAVYGVDGVAGHGGFLLFAILGGDVNKDFYDYYVSPYGDKRRCLYHRFADGSTHIVFDEALVDGEFFPSDYFEYFDEQEGGRSRVHMIDGVAGKKEDANFADPFASSYDVAAYNENGERVLAHYEDGNEINEQVIPDPDIAFHRDYTYKDGSLASHLRHNRLAEQPAIEKEEISMKESEVEEEKPVNEEAAPAESSEEAEKKAYERRASFAQKLAKADGLLRSRYDEIHAEMEAYGIHSRLSVPCDTYSLHRQDYLKITIDGKSMKLFFHLSPKDYEKTTIPCEDASDKKTYVDTPLLLHITSGLSVRRALGLIADMMAKAGISKKEKK